MATVSTPMTYLISGPRLCSCF